MEPDVHRNNALGRARLQYQPVNGDAWHGNVDEVVIILAILGDLPGDEIARKRNEVLRPCCGTGTDTPLLKNLNPTTEHTRHDLAAGVAAGYLCMTNDGRYSLTDVARDGFEEHDIAPFRPCLEPQA